MVQIKQTEDKGLLTEILKQLKENDNYCPCSLYKTPETKCMCKNFRDVIKANKLGIYECQCGRYIAEITED
jgi:hypothetical protein